MSSRKPTTHERRADHARAFDQVIDMYVDIQSTGGGSTLPKGVSKDSKVVKPSTCDFVCDVELTMARALPRIADRKTFLNLYKSFVMTEAEVDKDVLAFIKGSVGKLLISRKVYPIHQYFKEKAV